MTPREDLPIVAIVGRVGLTSERARLLVARCRVNRVADSVWAAGFSFTGVKQEYAREDTTASLGRRACRERWLFQRAKSAGRPQHPTSPNFRKRRQHHDRRDRPSRTSLLQETDTP